MTRARLTATMVHPASATTDSVSRAKPEVEKSLRLAEGRDELNLADFPISILERRQPRHTPELKVDSVTFTATRFNPHTQKRVPQQVTLTTSSRYGLPTPADEHVILGLLALARRSNDFQEQTVHFCPHELMRIMRWAPNSRSYARLRDVLRRLKALTITYENAWWDAEGRAYEEEFATGIIAEYDLVRQARGRRKADTLPSSWVTWTPSFFASLKTGNLKRLDLDELFSLQLPVAQRMYRFLDKRFHGNPILAMDLQDFACGHVGLSPTPNVALLKQRLSPGLAEPEGIGFLKQTLPETRYTKLRCGIWRINLQSGRSLAPASTVDPPSVAAAPTAETPPAVTGEPAQSPAEQLVRAFYARWSPLRDPKPSTKELSLAETILTEHGEPNAEKLLRHVLKRLKVAWPDAKTFVAIAAYLPEAIRDLQKAEHRSMQEAEAQLQEEHERSKHRTRNEAFQKLHAAWLALPQEQQDDIRTHVLAQQPLNVQKFPALIDRFCLAELARRQAPTVEGPNQDISAQ